MGSCTRIVLVPVDTAGWGDALLIGGEVPGASQQIGTVLGYGGGRIVSGCPIDTGESFYI